MIKVGKKEQKILEYLKNFPEGIWKEELINNFANSSKYRDIMTRRIYKMEEKGLIIIKKEINPQSGKYKQRVYLKQ